MHPHLQDSMQFLYMKDDVGYEEFLAAVYEAENEGTEGKVLTMKAKAMTVEMVIEEREKSELKDLKQQIELLTKIMKSANSRDRKDKVGKEFPHLERRSYWGVHHRKECRGHLRNAKYPSEQAKNLFSVLDVKVGVMDGMSVQLWKTSIGEK